MWLNKNVNPAFFNQLFEMAIRNEWDQVKLHSSGVYKTNRSPIFIEGFNLSRVNNSGSGFLMSHQVTLWRKDFLISQLKENEHPWRNERKGTKRLKKLDPVIFHLDYFAENGSVEINENAQPVGRSQYFTISENASLNDNIPYYIDQLMRETGQLNEYAKTLWSHYKNKITHDNLPQPRKTDIFKKIKNWLVQPDR